MAPQRRKQIQQYILSGERLIHVKDYSIPEPAFTMVSVWFVLSYSELYIHSSNTELGFAMLIRA